MSGNGLFLVVVIPIALAVLALFFIGGWRKRQTRALVEALLASGR